MTCSSVFQKDKAALRVEDKAERPELNVERPFVRLGLPPGRRGWELPRSKDPWDRGWRSSI